MKDFLRKEVGKEIINKIRKYKKFLKKLSENQTKIDGCMGIDHISESIRRPLIEENNFIKQSEEFLLIKSEFYEAMTVLIKKINTSHPDARMEYIAVLQYDFDSGARKAFEKVTVILKKLES